MLTEIICTYCRKLEHQTNKTKTNKYHFPTSLGITTVNTLVHINIVHPVL